MTSGQDPQQRHRLARQRLASALVARDSDPVRHRSTAGPALVGVLVTALAVGAVAAWAQWSGRDGDGWRRPGVVVMEDGTGARYLWRDGTLHPVPNYTSAQLLLAESAPPVAVVPGEQLRDVPRGAQIGQVGLPDRVPPADQLAAGPWSVCSAVEDGAVVSLLLVGAAPDGGRPLGEQAVLVAGPDGVPQLLWRQRRHQVPDPAALPGGRQDQSPVPVAAALLDAVPAGREPPSGTGAAEHTPDAGVELVAPAGGERAICAVTSGDDPARGELVLNAALPGPAARVAAAEATPGRATAGRATAGEVAVDAWVLDGPAALVTSGGASWLVSVSGVRHPVTPAALPLLGLAEAAPVPVPEPVVSLLPEGPELAPAPRAGR